MNKRGVSPIIATVLLIGIVIALGVIVFVWFSSFTQEAITKFNGENVQLVCNDVQFSASYASSDLTISNTGNVPIYSFNVQVNGGSGTYTTQDIKNVVGGWPNNGLKQGDVFSGGIIANVINGANQIILIPVLMGSVSNGGQKTYICPAQYGSKLSLT